MAAPSQCLPGSARCCSHSLASKLASMTAWLLSAASGNKLGPCRFVNISSIYIHRAQRKKPYSAQPHFRLAAAPGFPFEGVIKISLCAVGILGELYLSHHAHWRCVHSCACYMWFDLPWMMSSCLAAGRAAFSACVRQMHRGLVSYW